MGSISITSSPLEPALDWDFPARCVSVFVDLEAEVEGLQAWLESVATPVVNSAPPDPGERGASSPCCFVRERPGEATGG